MLLVWLQQYPAAQGCYFEPNNFTVNVVWLPYINLDDNKVDKDIPGVFIRQLIETRLILLATHKAIRLRTTVQRIYILQIQTAFITMQL